MRELAKMAALLRGWVPSEGCSNLKVILCLGSLSNVNRKQVAAYLCKDCPRLTSDTWQGLSSTAADEAGG